MPKVMLLAFQGPTQAWGYNSKFGERNVLPFPTRSAVLGLLAAAAGLPRDQIGSLKGLQLETFLFGNYRTLKDYHVAGGGYKQNLNYHDTFEKGPVLTNREFLVDSKSGIIVKGETGLLNKLSESLTDPKWGIYLGRKCCVPSTFVYQGLYETRETALKQLQELFPSSKINKVIKEVPLANLKFGTEVLLDVPLNFTFDPVEGRFTSRRVEIEYIGEEDDDI